MESNLSNAIRAIYQGGMPRNFVNGPTTVVRPVMQNAVQQDDIAAKIRDANQPLSKKIREMDKDEFINNLRNFIVEQTISPMRILGGEAAKAVNGYNANLSVPAYVRDSNIYHQSQDPRYNSNIQSLAY